MQKYLLAVVQAGTDGQPVVAQTGQVISAAGNEHFVVRLDNPRKHYLTLSAASLAQFTMFDNAADFTSFMRAIIPAAPPAPTSVPEEQPKVDAPSIELPVESTVAAA